MSSPKPGTSLLAMTQEASVLEAALMANAEANGGEISPELEALLAAVESQIEVKADSYKYLMDRLKYSAEMLFNQADQFNRAGSALETACEKLRDRLKEVMTIRGSDEVNGVNWRWKLQNAAPKLEVDMDKLPASFRIEKVQYAPNREAINAVLKAGETIEGVTVVPVKALRAYVKKGD